MITSSAHFLPQNSFHSTEIKMIVGGGSDKGTMDDEIIRTVWDEDGLMLHIISYVAAPKDVSAVFSEASEMLQAKPRLFSLFLQHLRSLPLTASYQYGDPDERPLLWAKHHQLLWAKHHQLKIRRLEADVSHVYIRSFIGCMTGMDLSELTHLMINLSGGWNPGTLNPRDIASVYHILNQPSIVELGVFDTTITDHYLCLLGIQGLKKVTIHRGHDNRIQDFQAMFDAIALSPSIEHFKAICWTFSSIEVEIASSTLKSLDVTRCQSMSIQRILCPSLNKLFCRDSRTIGGTRIVGTRVVGTRVADLVANTEEEVLDSDAPPGAISKKVSTSLQAIDLDNFQVGEDCQLVVYGFSELDY